MSTSGRRVRHGDLRPGDTLAYSSRGEKTVILILILSSEPTQGFQTVVEYTFILVDLVDLVGLTRSLITHPDHEWADGWEKL